MKTRGTIYGPAIWSKHTHRITASRNGKGQERARNTERERGRECPWFGNELRFTRWIFSAKNFLGQEPHNPLGFINQIFCWIIWRMILDSTAGGQDLGHDHQTVWPWPLFGEANLGPLSWHFRSWQRDTKQLLCKRRGASFGTPLTPATSARRIAILYSPYTAYGPAKDFVSKSSGTSALHRLRSISGEKMSWMESIPHSCLFLPRTFHKLDQKLS